MNPDNKARQEQLLSMTNKRAGCTTWVDRNQNKTVTAGPYKNPNKNQKPKQFSIHCLFYYLSTSKFTMHAAQLNDELSNVHNARGK